MRVTIVNRYFWPESLLVNDISRWLAAEGHEVQVLTGHPDYNPEAALPPRPRRETWNGVEIRQINFFRDSGRGMKRNLNSLLFILLAVFRVAFGRKTDIVWSTSIPPIGQPFLLRLATWMRGAKFIYFPQDIYPEIATTMAMMKPGRLDRLLTRIDTWTLSKADAVVTISHDMAEVFHARGATPKRLEVIRSFSPVEKPRPKKRQPDPGPLRFVFAGNIGRFQKLDTLIESFATIDPENAVLEMLGDGREKSRLMDIVAGRGISNVRFHGVVPVEEAFDFVARCDVGVISLSPGIYRYAFPAKTYTYIGAGLPLLAMVEHESELAQIVRERGIGEVVSFDEPVEALQSAAKRIIAQYRNFQDNLYTRTDDLYLPDVAREKWLALFGDIERQNVHA